MVRFDFGSGFASGRHLATPLRERLGSASSSNPWRRDMPGPTQNAEHYFKRAYDLAIAASMHTRDVQDQTGIAVYDIAASLSAVSKGLTEMAIGLRATYILIERVEQKLDRQRAR
jgi:hypothetical protein